MGGEIFPPYVYIIDIVTIVFISIICYRRFPVEQGGIFLLVAGLVTISVIAVN